MFGLQFCKFQNQIENSFLLYFMLAGVFFACEQHGYSGPQNKMRGQICRAQHLTVDGGGGTAELLR